MARSKIKKSESLPIRSSSQIKEDDSKDLFLRLIKPWMVVSWIEKDFGIDATIEITKPLASSSNQIVTGKRVSVQLKSSTSNRFDKKNFSLSVPKEKINYWMQSFEPVILIYVDLKESSAYYRWIDDRLIKEFFDRNSDWIANDSVSVIFDKSHTVNSKSLNIIERYVLTWKRPSRTLLTPGNYFNFSNEAFEYTKKLKELCDKYSVKVLNHELSNLIKSVSNSIYTIAIIGRSRVGKSTLINALLERDISPVGKLPTTGIPITIVPKNENRAFVTLKKRNKVIEGAADSKFVAEYSAQDKNPRNEKGVKHIRVHVINTLLERGFALCDVPGLDDADPEIKSVAQTAIFSSNAIVYVISLAGYQYGEFMINDNDISDLNKLRGKMDRVFLVFNKADNLSREDLIEVRKYIDRTLEQYGILNFLAAPPIFISSIKAYERRMKKEPGSDSVSNLEQVLWEYLINQNSTGLHKIISSFADEIELIYRLKNIGKVRLDHTDKRKAFDAEINNVQREIDKLHVFISTETEKLFTEIYGYVIDRFNNAIDYLSNQLRGAVTRHDLPNTQQISEYLENEAYKILSEVYEYLQSKSNSLQSKVNTWVGQKLNQVELSIDDIARSQQYHLPEIHQYTGQVYSFFNTNRVGYIGVFENIVSSIGEVLEWIFGGLLDFFTEDQKLREREINKIVVTSTKSYNRIQTELLKNVENYLNAISRKILENTRDRTNVYLGELKAEANMLDMPLSRIEREQHSKFLDELESIETEILSHYNQLISYTDGIELYQTSLSSC